MYIYYVTRVGCCLWISICKYSYTYNLHRIIEHVTYRSFFPLFYSPPPFLAPYPLRVGFLQINSEFLPLQNEALGSCFKMRSKLARKVYVVHVVLWRICRTIDSISWTTYIRFNLESWQKKWRFLSAKRHVRMFQAMLFIIANKTMTIKKNWKQPTWLVMNK